MLENNITLLNYLNSAFTKTVRDPLWNDIKLTNNFMLLYKSKKFQQLNGIKQLGPTYLVYPGAVHTRLIHSIGVYNLSRKIIISLLQKDTIGFTLTGINSFLVAAMLHDIGHFPYAHSLKDIISISHETLGANIIENDQEISNCIKNIGADRDSVCQIIDKTKPTNNKEIILYRHLLSGALDPDKLDYLCRDAFFCGVPYGIQDVSYIIDKLFIKDNMPCLKEQELASLENLLFSKYLMYQNVYWNKNVRSATAMIKSVVLSAFNEKIINKSDLFEIDDNNFSNLSKLKSFKSYPLFKQVENNNLLKMYLEIPFKKLNKEKAEKTLYNYLKPNNPNLNKWEVIVDIPEPISFESNFQILTDNNTIEPFNKIDPIFNIDTIGNFTKALRKLRVFLPYNIDISGIQLEKIVYGK